MIRYLIKNYIKLMSRSITNILLFIICPLILIAVLSSAFKDLMEKYEGDFHMDAGYKTVGDIPEEMLDGFKEEAEKKGLVLHEYQTEDPEEAMKREDISGFIVFGIDSYTVYQSDEYKNEGKFLEYVVSSFYESVANAYMGIKTEPSELKVEHPAYMKEIDSKDYYGIIEIIYFGWCAIVCGTAIFTSEKKYRIRKKLQVSSLSEFKLYLAKFLPMVIVVAVATIIAALLSVVLFGVHWGNPIISGLILVLSVAASVAFGLMFYYIFDNMVVTIIGVFGTVWFAGFFGGSFETYMFSAHSQTIKLMTPIYHVNRALAELSCMGHSDYIVSAIIFCAGITIVCSLISGWAGNLRRRGRA